MPWNEIKAIKNNIKEIFDMLLDQLKDKNINRPLQ